MNRDTCILVSSCDSYQDVISLLMASFNEYWRDCDFPIYVSSESIVHSSPYFSLQSINCDAKDSSSWGLRMLNSLKQLEEEFVIVLYDDYVLESLVDVSKIGEILEKFRQFPTISCFYLKWLDFKIEKDTKSGLFKISDDNYYKVNSGPAIWRRKELIKLIDQKDNPWAWEFFAMYRKAAKSMGFYTVDSNDSEIYTYANEKGGAVYRGKWVEEVAVPKILKYALALDIQQRGTIKSNEKNARTISWKLGFMAEGFRMVGLKVLHLFPHYFMHKFKAKNSNVK